MKGKTTVRTKAPKNRDSTQNRGHQFKIYYTSVTYAINDVLNQNYKQQCMYVT